MVLRSEFDKVYREHRDGTYAPKKREENPVSRYRKNLLQSPTDIIRQNRLQSHIR